MDKARKKDFVIKICCFIVAFGLWLYIANIENPIKSTVIRNVKVNIINEDILSQYNLVELPNQNYTVNITVKGATSEIYSIKPSQFKVEADISAYALKKGVMRIPIEIKEAPSNVSIINKESLWVKIELDNFKKKHVPVKVNIKGQVNHGFKSSEPLITPKDVLLSGPEQYVNSVSYASIDVNLNNETKNIDEMYSAKPVDVSGNRVDYVSIEPNKVRIQIPLDKTKYVPVEANVKPAKDKVITNISVIPESVSISGDENQLRKIDKITTEEIDLSNLNSGEIIEVLLKIPGNVKVLNSSKVKVKVVFNSIVQKNLSATIKVKNLKDNFDAVLNHNEVSFIVSGPDDKIRGLKKEALDCYVDVNSLGEGTYNVPVNIKLPDFINKISYNPQTIKVTIKNKEVSEGNAD